MVHRCGGASPNCCGSKESAWPKCCLDDTNHEPPSLSERAITLDGGVGEWKMLSIVATDVSDLYQ